MSASDKHYPSLLPFVFALLALNLFLVAFFGFAFYSLRRYKRHYVVDEESFIVAVSNSVNSFLSEVVVPPPSSSVHSEPSPSSSLPSVLLVESLGFASSPRRGNYFIYRDSCYRQGDFCEFGLVVSVGEDRAFCNSTNGLVILRPFYPDVKNSWFASGRGDASQPSEPAKKVPDRTADASSHSDALF